MTAIDVPNAVAITGGLAMLAAIGRAAWLARRDNRARCATCGEPIEGATHAADADTATIADCADQRGDEPVRPA
jgi:hypothetical protein